MVYTLVPLVRVGLPGGQSTRRPFGYDRAPHTFVVLDAGDPSQPSSGLALVCFEASVTDARVVKLAEGKGETLAAATRTALAAKVNDRAFSKSDLTFDATIADLLKAPPAAWKLSPLRKQIDGRIVVWLGPEGPGRNLFFEEFVGLEKHSQAFADTFARADATLNGSSLSGGVGTWAASGWTVESNAAATGTMGAFGGGDALVSTQGDTDSLYSQADLVSLVSQASDLVSWRLYACVDNGAANGYYFTNQATFGAGYRAIYSILGDTELVADSVVSTSGTFLLMRNGSSLQVFKDGVSILGPITDTSEASGVGVRYVGFQGFCLNGNTPNGIVVDNYLGGDAVQPSAVTTKTLAALGVG